MFCPKHDPGNRTNHYGEFLWWLPWFVSVLKVCILQLITHLNKTNVIPPFYRAVDFESCRRGLAEIQGYGQKARRVFALGNAGVWASPNSLQTWHRADPSWSYSVGRPKQLLKTSVKREARANEGCNWQSEGCYRSAHPGICACIKMFTLASSVPAAVRGKPSLSFWRIPKSFLSVTEGLCAPCLRLASSAGEMQFDLAVLVLADWGSWESPNWPRGFGSELAKWVCSKWGGS